MQAKPGITFLGPVFNKAAWIAETVESLQNQTFKDIEIIFIDDGSTDGTRDILEYYKKGDSRIKVYGYKKNRGLGYAWNYGTQFIRGEIVCVASGDDVFLPLRAGATYKYFKKHLDKDVFYGAYWFCNYHLEKIEFKPAVPFKKGEMFKILPNGRPNQYIGHGTMAYRADIARKVPYRKNLRVGVDLPFLKDLETYGCKFGWTTEPLVMFRLLTSGVSISRSREVEVANKS